MKRIYDFAILITLMTCCVSIYKCLSQNTTNSWFVINNTRFIFLIQQTLKLSNVRKGQLLNIFLSIAMPCFTSLLESWMPSFFILLLFSIKQTVQQVSCVKNRLIRDEFTHLDFSISIRYLCQKFDNNQLFFSKKNIDDHNMHKSKTRDGSISTYLDYILQNEALIVF